MKCYKKIISVFIICTLLLSMPFYSFAEITTVKKVNYAQKVVDNDMPKTYEDIKLSGKIPKIETLPSQALQDLINIRLLQQYNSFLKNAPIDTKSVSFTYEAKMSSDYCYILFFANITGATLTKQVSTTVIDTSRQKIIYINDILGPNGVKLINEKIARKIAAEPSKYNNTFTGIKEDHDFYIDGERVVILFDDYEISATNSKNYDEIIIMVSDIKNIVLNKGSYYTNSDYATKMVKLKDVCDALGYTLSWSSDINAVIIFDDRQILTSLNVGVNKYKLSISGSSRSLEEAPTIYKDGRTYVPLSFFEEILGLTYYVDNDGTITLSKLTAL